MKSQQKIKKTLSPVQVIIFGYFLIILLGGLLLMLPISSVNGEFTPFTEAVFTSTSATCVTGLVVHDTYTYWSGFGQAVILLLIQVGGLGFISMAVMVAMLAGKKINIKQRIWVKEAFALSHTGGVIRLTRFVILATIFFEGLGTILLSIKFIPEFGFWRGLYFSFFHAISAFCNAGFDLMGKVEPFSSLTGYYDNAYVSLIICTLIIIGGLGFIVWHDLSKNKHHFKKYSLQSKVVIITTTVLLFGGTIFIFVIEANGVAFAESSLSEKWLQSFFHSVTTRTAGFNTVNLNELTGQTLFLTIVLMLIGGSPGSTAGGFKTSTLAICITSILSVGHKKHSVEFFGRRLNEDILRRAISIVSMYLLLFVLSSIIISSIEQMEILPVMFECASAIGTVGLSMGITTEIGLLSKYILIFLMYFGRVGALTMLYALADHNIETSSRLPFENIAVG